MPRRQIPTPVSTGEMLTRDEAAARLGCSPKTLRNQAHLRRGPRYVRFGREVRYPAGEIARVLQAAIEGRSLDWDR